MHAICHFPRLAHPTADLQIRRALLPRFPYALVFVELGTISVCLPYLTSSVVPTIGSTA